LRIHAQWIDEDFVKTESLGILNPLGLVEEKAYNLSFKVSNSMTLELISYDAAATAYKTRSRRVLMPNCLTT
jgi:hypothetical protein